MVTSAFFLRKKSEYKFCRVGEERGRGTAVYLVGGRPVVGRFEVSPPDYPCQWKPPTDLAGACSVSRMRAQGNKEKTPGSYINRWEGHVSA